MLPCFVLGWNLPPGPPSSAAQRTPSPWSNTPPSGNNPRHSYPPVCGVTYSSPTVTSHRSDKLPQQPSSYPPAPSNQTSPQQQRSSNQADTRTVATGNKPPVEANSIEVLFQVSFKFIRDLLVFVFTFIRFFTKQAFFVLY